jgi:hypothetical protein
MNNFNSGRPHAAPNRRIDPVGILVGVRGPLGPTVYQVAIGMRPPTVMTRKSEKEF